MLEIYIKPIATPNDLFGDFEIRYFASLRKPFMDSLPALRHQSLVDLDNSISFYVKNMVRSLLEDKEMNQEATQLERVKFTLHSMTDKQHYCYDLYMTKYFYLPRAHKYNMLADDVVVIIDCDEEGVNDMSPYTLQCLGFDLSDKLAKNYEGHVLRFTKHLYETVNMWYKLSCRQKLSKEVDVVSAVISDGVLEYAYKHEGHAPSEDAIMTMLKKAAEEESDYFKKEVMRYATLVLACQFLSRAFEAHKEMIEETKEYHILKEIGYELSEERVFQLWTGNSR